MVELQRMPGPGSARILVKVEGLNVGGSIKTRTAFNMISAAEKAGKINKDTIIDQATYADPFLPNIGIEMVFVSGQAAVVNNKPTGVLNGKVYKPAK